MLSADVVCHTNGWKGFWVTGELILKNTTLRGFLADYIPNHPLARDEHINMISFMNLVNLIWQVSSPQKNKATQKSITAKIQKTSHACLQFPCLWLEYYNPRNRISNILCLHISVHVASIMGTCIPQCIDCFIFNCVLIFSPAPQPNQGWINSSKGSEWIDRTWQTRQQLQPASVQR